MRRRAPIATSTRLCSRRVARQGRGVQVWQLGRQRHMSHDDRLIKKVDWTWIGHILLNRSINIAANMTSTAQATTHVAGLLTTQFFNSNACWPFKCVQMGMCGFPFVHNLHIDFPLDPLALNATNVTYTAGVAAHQLPLF